MRAQSGLPDPVRFLRTMTDHGARGHRQARGPYPESAGRLLRESGQRRARQVLAAARAPARLMADNLIRGAGSSPASRPAGPSAGPACARTWPAATARPAGQAHRRTAAWRSSGSSPRAWPATRSPQPAAPQAAAAAPAPRCPWPRSPAAAGHWPRAGQRPHRGQTAHRAQTINDHRRRDVINTTRQAGSLRSAGSASPPTPRRGNLSSHLRR